MIIAIDGPSGTGKSTVAKGVANALGFAFFDTGAMYRSVAWWLIHENIPLSDEKTISSRLPEFNYEIQGTGENKKYLVRGMDVTTAIRSHEISSAASKIAVYQDVRKTLVQIQREFGARKDSVFEGRDMGSVVFPKAEIKIFLTARAQTRAKRRYEELRAKSPDNLPSEEQILKDIEERDTQDSTRTHSPLKQADDALLIDTSDLTANQVIELIVKIAEAKTKMHIKLFYRFFCTLVRLYLKIFFRFKVYGTSHFRPGAAIIAANHGSFMDPPLIAAACPEEIHFLARESLFSVPLIGRLIRRLNAHPVSRSAADIATFKMILKLLENGNKTLLFPEGQRTHDGELLPVERGLSFLVLKSHCRIQPVYIEGAFKAWPRTQKYPNLFGKITCAFGSPIEWEEFENLDKKDAEKKILERVGNSLKALKNWLAQGAAGTPP